MPLISETPRPPIKHPLPRRLIRQALIPRIHILRSLGELQIPQLTARKGYFRLLCIELVKVRLQGVLEILHFRLWMEDIPRLMTILCVAGLEHHQESVEAIEDVRE